MASGADRLAMCRLAAETLSFCEVDSCELERSGVSYTVDTVRLFRERYPEAELVLLVGSDMFLYSPVACWQEIWKWLRWAWFPADGRSGTAAAAAGVFICNMAKFFLCDVPVYTVSSTKIR